MVARYALRRIARLGEAWIQRAMRGREVDSHVLRPNSEILPSRSLAKYRLSDNVGGVKHFSRTLQRALGEERHFALVDGFAFSNPGSLVISQVGNSVRPMHLFCRQRPIMI